MPAVPILTRFQITTEKCHKNLFGFFLTFFFAVSHLDITEAHFTRNNLFIFCQQQNKIKVGSRKLFFPTFFFPLKTGM